MVLKAYSFLSALALSLLVAASASATTWRVPSEFPTIQAGINAASSTDTVLVAPGTYSGPGNWDITFAGKDIVLLSEAGPAATILDALSGTAGNHRVFYLGFSGATTSRIDGFTITGGRQCASGAVGAGIVSGGGAPTIANCVIRGNWTGCSDPSKSASLGCGMGGGLFIGSAPEPIRIVDCVIEENGGNCVAGAIWIEGSPDVTFERCVIVRNRELGVLLRGNTQCTFVNCTIANTALTSDFEYGLGLSVTLGASAIFDRSIVWANCMGIQVTSGSSIQATCTIFDTSAVYGTGEIALNGWNAFSDPLFCDPNVCPVWPISDPGDYRVQPQSAALPENNPCGVLIGALGSCAATSVPPSFQPPDDVIWASPNPFSASTSLSLTSAIDRDATLSVFDVAGRRVREFRMTRAAAPVAWDGTDENGQSVAAGMYLLRLEGRRDLSGRVTVVR
jgi:parallel beta-helix repeat protein